MTRTRLHALLVLSLLVSSGTAGHRSAVAGPEVAAAVEPRVFMWEVASETGTIYLLGSIHLAKPDLYPLDPAIEAAFARSSVLVVEADISGPASSASMMRFMTEGVYPDGERLSDHLSARTRGLLDTYLAQRSISRAMVENMRPWLAAMTLNLLELQRLGFDATLGIDFHFLEQARELNKPIEELESIDFQVDLLSGFDEAQQELFLAYMIEESEELEELTDTMFDAWGQGDTERLQSVFARYEDNDELDFVMEKFLFERNEGMARKIRGYLEEPETRFVVVGSAHIGGERGILDLLEREGSLRINQTKAISVTATETVEELEVN